MAFVKFTETGKSFSPRVSINPRGYLSFNDGARRRLGIDKYTRAILYHDADAKKIGVEFTNNVEAEGAIKLRSRQTGATLGAKSFLDFFDIKIEKTTIYDVKNGDSPEWVIIDLTTGRERNTKDDEGEEDTP